MTEKMKVPMRIVQSMAQYQSRAGGLNMEAVEEYAERYKNGEPMDPIQVCGQRHIAFYVVDGHHRYEAMKRAGFGLNHEIEVEVVDHRTDPAVIRWEAAGSNTSHGIRRTRADKRKAVVMCLKDFPLQSNPDIARHCGVSRIFVWSIRKELDIKDVDDGNDAPATQPESVINHALPPPPPPQPTPPKAPEVVNINQNAEVEKAATPEQKQPQPVPPLPVPPPPPMPKAPSAPPPPPPTPPSAPEEPAKEPEIPWPTEKRDSGAQPEREYKEGAGGHRNVSKGTDAKFRYIPDDLKEFWDRRGEVLSLRAKIRDILHVLESGIKRNDPLWSKATQSTLESLKGVLRTVEDCEPLYVCPACGGLNPGCQLCGHRGGFIGREEYENVVMKDPALMKFMQRQEQAEKEMGERIKNTPPMPKAPPAP